MNYSISYDTATKIITPIALIAMVAGLGTLWMTGIEEMRAYKYLSLAVLFIVLILSWGYAPKSYSIDDGRVCVNRMLMQPFEILISDIASVEVVPKQRLKGSIRTFGSGAFFGYYGRFTNRHFGAMRWYATNLNNAVLIRTRENKKIILTPNERDSFINAIQSSIKKAA